MARYREFDPDRALHDAMLVFWRNGYANTTMAQLVEATGVVRASLYSTFGNKAALFRKAIERYSEFQASRVADAESPGQALLAWFADAVRGAPAGELPTGCLLINTASEYGTLDPELQRLVKAHLARVHQFFHHCVAKVAPDLDAEATANVLMGANVSIYLLGRTGAPEGCLRDIADAALAPIAARL